MSRAIKKVIHVDQHAIKRNNKLVAGFEPVISIKTYKQNLKVFALEISGPATVVYRPAHPLSCGARCWVETKSAVLGQVSTQPGSPGKNWTAL